MAEQAAMAMVERRELIDVTLFSTAVVGGLPSLS
jgi:hypothetical protein